MRALGEQRIIIRFEKTQKRIKKYFSKIFLCHKKHYQLSNKYRQTNNSENWKLFQLNQNRNENIQSMMINQRAYEQ